MLPRKGESEEERRELRWWGGERRGEEEKGVRRHDKMEDSE